MKYIGREVIHNGKFGKGDVKAMNKIIRIITCFFMLFMLFGCKQETEIEHPGNEEIEAEKEEKEKKPMKL